MIVKQIIDEDFVNHKKPSMFIAFPSCTWKCEKECGKRVCQNSALATAPNIKVSPDEIAVRYIDNSMTKAIVVGGLEPLDNYEELIELIHIIRTKHKCNDDIVIYTGYNRAEIEQKLTIIKKFKNIIIKFGRYIPYQNSHYDDTLGVTLASDNQYAERIS